MKKYKLSFVMILLMVCQFLSAQLLVEINGFHEIPFELTSHNNISIKAVINKTDTVNLMFHTAVSSVTVTTEASKDISTIDWNSEEEINSWGGKGSAKYSKNNSLQIGNMNWDSLAIWETRHSGPTTDGKFGPNLFEGKVIEIDFDKSVLIIYESLPVINNDYVKMPLIYENEFMFVQGMSMIKGIDYQNRFLIHSGYGGTILFDDKFVSESKIGEHVEIISEKELKDSNDNILKTKKGKLPKFTIGKEDFEDIPVGFFEGSIGRQQMSVIGGDLLKRFNIIIDKNREYIYLVPNQLKGLAYTEFK